MKVINGKADEAKTIVKPDEGCKPVTDLTLPPPIPDRRFRRRVKARSISSEGLAHFADQRLSRSVLAMLIAIDAKHKKSNSR